jgi:hypothetical protein
VPVTGHDIANEARRWIGTPFRHQGRMRGAGVDCVGLVAGVGVAIGVGGLRDVPADYTRRGSYAAFMSHVCHYLDPLDEAADPPDGAVAAFWLRTQGHIGLIAHRGKHAVLIHAYAHRGVKAVVEVSLDIKWMARLIGLYSYRGVALSW